MDTNLKIKTPSSYQLMPLKYPQSRTEISFFPMNPTDQVVHLMTKAEPASEILCGFQNKTKENVQE
jgi:hypothetical protein